MTSDENSLPKDRMQMLFGPTHDAADTGGDAMIDMVVATILAMSNDQRRRLATRMARLDKPTEEA